ncbi:MAG: branched-chain amino acid ABC transporter permease [Chloroflexi bacterium]|nr:MAG: branched-chain amino acid ABC transporter permease [Chloroflexota bacterium]TME19381.1 MAG: branched-chain amino acid ABC transporter permease [Chloroflexota bacterium]
MIELVSGNPVQAFVQQVVSGLASGAVYASLALSLVLIYRAMDVANFAQGEMAMFSTFIAYALITGFHLPYLIAFALTIAISFGGGVLIERVVIRPFEGSSVLTLVIVTLALFSIVNGTAGLIWGYVFKTFDSPFQFGAVHFQGLYIGYQDLGIIGVTLVVLALVFVFFRYTKLGLAMRAASLYPEASRLLGVRTGWMLAFGWGISAAVGAVSGMMIAPVVFLDPGFMQPVLLFAFVGAVLGGIESPLGAVVGGVLVGVLLALLGTYVPGGENLRIAMGLVVIVAVLLIKPAGLFGRSEVRRV